ncbi:MAG: tetratricopeptide repeat protein [Roseovarius sp.]
MLRTLTVIATLIPSALFAAGGETAPKPSETTQSCTGGQVWDAATKSCVDVKSDLLNDDTLYGAVREFAYAGQYENAQQALAQMSDPNDDRVLTYMGFTTRKMGDVDAGIAYYEQAIANNPGNILARSYMGQALVEQGKLDAANRQLTAINAAGGQDSWAATSLRTAIKTGATYSY